MKKAITLLMLMTASSGYCGKVQIEFLDITADRSVTVTGSQSNDIAEAKSHVVDTDNPHGVTAAQIGALTAEQDLAALRTYHYGSPDIVESPAEWFNGQGTIIGFISGPGRTNAVIPWAIGGVAVTNIGSTAFYPEGSTMPSTYHFGRFVRSIGAQAFFYNTDATHLYFSGDAPTVGANAFLNANEGLTATVINPQATGWGATLSDGTRSIPVIRPALHTDLMRIQVMQHVDSYTNLIWQSIYSNGWHWLVAYTNTPGGGE